MTVDTERGLDMNADLMLDGNALAGTLHEIFGADVTAASCECAACGNHAEVGTFLAFTHGPGAVLRCSTCGAVTLRIVERTDAYLLDTRGLAWMRIERIRGAAGSEV
jgi:uncharacterized protein DUF6510